MDRGIWGAVMRLRYISDPGHAWLIVSQHQLKQARLGPADFPNAYQTPNGEILALEEDCEWPKFTNRLESMGVVIDLDEQYIDDYDHPDNPRTWPRVGD